MSISKDATLVKEEIKVDKSPSGETQLIESKPIANSAFVAQRYDKTWIVTIGRYRTGNSFESFEECEEYVLNPDWELHMLTIQAVIDANQNKINELKKS